MTLLIWQECKEYERELRAKHNLSILAEWAKEQEMKVRTTVNKTEDFDLKVVDGEVHIPGSIKWLQSQIKRCHLKFGITEECKNQAIFLKYSPNDYHKAYSDFLLAFAENSERAAPVKPRFDDTTHAIELFNVKLTPKARDVIVRMASNAAKLLEAKIKQDDEGEISL